MFVFANWCELRGGAARTPPPQFDLDHSVTKSGPEACDLHAICLLKLKFVSVSMTMDESYIVHL